MTGHASSSDTTARPACGRHRCAVLLAVGALSLPVLSSHAEVIDIVWRTKGRFDRHLTVLPGEFEELCGALNLGQTVNWSFDADGALNFNIRYHAGKDVRYPKRLNQTYRSRGSYRPYLLLLACSVMHLFHCHGGHGRLVGHGVGTKPSAAREE